MSVVAAMAEVGCWLGVTMVRWSQGGRWIRGRGWPSKPLFWPVECKHINSSIVYTHTVLTWCLHFLIWQTLLHLARSCRWYVSWSTGHNDNGEELPTKGWH